jgi:DNA-binding transcriptional ArsR family regulator
MPTRGEGKSLDDAVRFTILKQMLQRSDELDLMFQALADAGRRSMVDRLAKGPASVSELAEPLDMSLSAVVQHLKVLEASGLVRSEKLGRVRSCQLDTGKLQLAEQWINQRRTQWEGRLDRLGDFLARTAPKSDPGER